MIEVLCQQKYYMGLKFGCVQYVGELGSRAKATPKIFGDARSNLLG